MFSRLSSKKFTPEQQRILRAHWQWAGGYALFWIIATVIIFGGIFLVFDYLGVDDNVRTQSFILLATVTLVNAIWRAVGALAARIEVMLTERDHDKFKN